jgi:hypothetical protein
VIEENLFLPSTLILPNPELHMVFNLTWWHTPVILALRRLRQEDHSLRLPWSTLLDPVSKKKIEEGNKYKKIGLIFKTKLSGFNIIVILIIMTNNKFSLNTFLL